jgi:hypothetical protein
MPSMEMSHQGEAKGSPAETVLLSERNRIARRVPLFLRSAELGLLPPWEQAEVAFGEARSFSERRTVRYVGLLWSALCLAAWWSLGPQRFGLVPIAAILVVGALLPAVVATSFVRRRIHAQVLLRQTVRANTGAGV